MKYLLDSNAIIALLAGNADFVDRLKSHPPSEFGISSVVLHELYYGAFKSQRRDVNLGRVEEIGFEVIAFDREDARHSGEIRAKLALAGTPIGPFDTLIAGQALARSLVLITRNVREFSRVEGLAFENWL